MRPQHARRRLPLLFGALLVVAMGPVGIAIRALEKTSSASRPQVVAKASPSPTAAMPSPAAADPSTPVASPGPSEEPTSTAAPPVPTAAPVGTPVPTARPTPRPTSAPTPTPTHAPLPAPTPTSYPLPNTTGQGEFTYAAAAPDGSVWVADQRQAWLWQVYPTQGLIQMPLASCTCSNGVSTNIAIGPGGTLWVGATAPTASNVTTAFISRVTVSGTQAYTDFALPAASNPTVQWITNGPDGALWFTQPAAGIVGRITTDGVVTQYSVGSAPYSITSGPDGALWFSDRDSGLVHRISTTGAVTAFPSPAASGASIATGPDGNLWISGSGSLVRMTPAGVATVFPIPAPKTATPASLLAGADGGIWFTDSANYALGEVAPDGYVQEFPMKDPFPQETTFSGNFPFIDNITRAADGHLWVLTDYQELPPCMGVMGCSLAGLYRLS